VFPRRYISDVDIDEAHIIAPVEGEYKISEKVTVSSLEAFIRFFGDTALRSFHRLYFRGEYLFPRLTAGKLREDN